MVLLTLVIVISVLALCFAAYLTRQLLAKDTGSQAMQEVSNAIKIGAEAFLKRQNSCRQSHRSGSFPDHLSSVHSRMDSFVLHEFKYFFAIFGFWCFAAITVRSFKLLHRVARRSTELHREKLKNICQP